MSLSCLQEAIIDLAQSINYIRQDIGDYDDHGVWIDAPETEGCIQAVVQPAQANMIKDIPEGRRLSDALVIYTIEPLYTIQLKDRKQNDQIIWNSKKYEVTEVIDRSHDGGYYESKAWLIQE